MPDLHDFELRTIDGEEKALSDYAGKVVLIVNVASRCGLTPQYDGLQRLYEQYRGRGLEVLGIPCNQFAGQEPGSESEIEAFCRTQYGVDFPLFSKIEVNGDGADPLYAWLTSQDVGPEGSGDVKWNFGKFLVAKDGSLAGRFEPATEPQSGELTAAIEALL
jgi:glutathione peroxidase